MALNIKNVETDCLAHELAAPTDEGLTTVTRRHNMVAVERDVAEIQAFVASLPDRDARPPDEILGYDELGLPGIDVAPC